MGILTEEMKQVVLEQRLGYVATVCQDGTPNLSPKGTTTVWDSDHLAFADIRSPKTVINLRHNPAVEINVVDCFARKGFRFKGTATLITEGPIFEKGLALYEHQDLSDAPRRIQTIVLVRVERALPLISPAYDRGASEAKLVTHWEQYYRTLRHQSE